MIKVDRYYKNFILCGDVDFHCLLCAETFDGIALLDRHIMWEVHRKLIKDVAFAPKLRKHLIYKINNIFYCQHCNYAMSSFAEATAHVSQPKHIETKANPIIEVPKSKCEKITSNDNVPVTTVFIGTLKISLKDWHGVVNNKCVICDCVVTNTDFPHHIKMSSHMIDIIQSEICTPDGVQFYRKLSKGVCYCFMCKSLFPVATTADHCDDENHIEKMRLIKEAEIRDRKKRAEVNLTLVNSQREWFNIDPENKVAECKICTAYIYLAFDKMIEHKKEHNIKSGEKLEKAKVDMEEIIEMLKEKKIEKKDDDPKLYVFDHGKRRSELAKYGREHFIKLVPPGAKGFCNLCNRYMSAHMNNFTNHVAGKIHQGFLELKGLNTTPRVHIKPKYTTKPLKDYLNSVIHAQEFNILWVNKQLFFDIYSFMLIAIIDKKAKQKKVKCFACNVIFDHEKVLEHIGTEEHKQVHLDSLVLTTIGEGFIREIQTNLYHCGVCNLIFPFWTTLNKHINGWTHSHNKNVKIAIHKLAEQWYVRFVPNSLAPEEVYPYLMTLNMFQ